MFVGTSDYDLGGCQQCLCAYDSCSSMIGVRFVICYLELKINFDLFSQKMNRNENGWSKNAATKNMTFFLKTQRFTHRRISCN